MFSVFVCLFDDGFWKLLEELLSMDNCIFTSHTAFYTDEAIENIADITLTNLYEMSSGQCGNEL